MNYPQIIKDIYNQQDAMFGTIAVLSPPIANFVKDAGYDTAEKFTEWVMQSGNSPAAAAQGEAGRQGRLSGSTPVFTVVVTGGSNNNYWCMGGMRPQQSVQIDKWR
jgi:hypothetical protein